MDIHCDYAGTTTITYTLILGTDGEAHTYSGDFPTWVADSNGSNEASTGDRYYFNHMNHVDAPLLGEGRGMYVGSSIGVGGRLDWPETVTFISTSGPVTYGWLHITDTEHSLERVELQAFGHAYTVTGGTTLQLAVTLGFGMRAAFEPNIPTSACSVTGCAIDGSGTGYNTCVVHGTIFCILLPNGLYRLLMVCPYRNSSTADTLQYSIMEYSDGHKVITVTSTLDEAEYFSVGAYNAYPTFKPFTMQCVSYPISLGGEPLIPALDITQSRLVTLFNPGLEDLNDLAGLLWSSLKSMDEIIANLKKIVQDPMDLLISLITVPAKPDIEEEKTIVNFGGITFGNKVTMYKVTSQYKEIDFGTVTVPLNTGTYLDYNPYTKITLYLPYIGGVDLNTDWVIGKPLHLKYTIDVSNGDCIAQVWVDGYSMYQFAGNCATHVPLTAANHSRQLVAGATALSAALPIALGGVAGLPESFRQAEKAISYVGKHEVHDGPAFESLPYATFGVPNYAGTSVAGTYASTTLGPAIQAGRRIIPLAGAATVAGGKTRISITGAIGASAGSMMEQTPYIVVEYPRMDVPANLPHYIGYPTNVTKTVGECSGFTVFSEINLMSIPCTDDERVAIEEFMTGGFYAN